MKLTALLILLGTSSTAGAFDVCERLPVDAEVPAGFGGSYELVGKDPVTGEAYAGMLVVGYGKSSYRLTRTALDKTVNGDAWIESCGTDKVKVLVARYYTKPMIELSCTLRGDGDNYYRATCKTRQGERQKGLEAWFQRR